MKSVFILAILMVADSDVWQIDKDVKTISILHKNQLLWAARAHKK